MSTELDSSTAGRSKAAAREIASGGKRKRATDAGASRSLNGSGKNSRSNSAGTRTTFFKRGGGGAADADGGREGRTTLGRGRPQDSHYERKTVTLKGLGVKRYDTVSVALPASAVGSAQTKEIKSYLAGQVARALALFAVDEVVVYDDEPPAASAAAAAGAPPEDTSSNASRNPLQFLTRLLEYADTPAYLKRELFGNHFDLQFASLMPVPDAGHHPRKGDACKYREGATLSEKEGEEGKFQSTLVNCGCKTPVSVPMVIPAGTRVTVKIGSYKAVKCEERGSLVLRGEAVSSDEPREVDGRFWGYKVRGVRGGVKKVMETGPWEGGYDLKIGVVEDGGDEIRKVLGKKGEDGGMGGLPKYSHALLVFGGARGGLAQAIDDDEDFAGVGGEGAVREVFDVVVGSAPEFRGSRNVRVEEALVSVLGQMRGAFVKNTRALKGKRREAEKEKEPEVPVTFSDEELSSEEEEDEEEKE